MEYAERMGKIKKSFIREILKVTEHSDVISFAGGLPNPKTFPVEEIMNASERVLREDGRNALQYSTTEGYRPLRQYIADRYYKRYGFKISADEILITSGSQQGLDLLGKILLNKGDHVIIEAPGYLGAIQSLSVYEPEFHSIPLNSDGIDIDKLKKVVSNVKVKLYYAVPNFQNPSGITYSAENKKKVAEVLKDTDTIFVADDPYGELRFMGKNVTSIKTFYKEKAVLLGSFSKIVSPGMRIGWICAEPEIMEKLIIVKQAADLHTNYFSQRVIYQYIKDNNLDEHIESIRKLYKSQRDKMVEMLKKFLPDCVRITEPEGGMFLWVTLPKNISSLELLKDANKENIAFVPGDPFYVDRLNVNSFRLNYTCSNNREIEDGIKRLSKVIRTRL